MKSNEHQLVTSKEFDAGGSSRPVNPVSILVAIDFSRFSEGALDYALLLTETFNAKVTLIHVVEPLIVPQTLMVTTEMEVDMRMVQERQEMLESLRRDRISASIPSEAIVKTGEPWEKIIEEAKLLRSDLIITASHGHSALEDIPLGNTAERVVRHALCSVLTVHKSVEAPLVPTVRLKKILVPIDFSAASEKALSKAVILAKRFGSEIVLAHVMETDPMQAALSHVPDAAKAAEPEGILARLGQQRIPADIAREIVVRVARPFKAICEAAKTLEVDLIIITSHGHNVLKWDLLGSTAERVVRHAPCAVWTLRG